MIQNIQTIGRDGKDQIIFSNSYNIYDDELTIPDFLGFNFKFIFEINEPRSDQKDVFVAPGKDKDIVITLSKRFRNTLGSITSEKLAIITTKENKQILFSIFGQETGNKALHVTVNFYLR